LRGKLRAWGQDLLPPLAWTLVVLSLSSSSFSGETTGRLIDRVFLVLWPALLERLDPTQLDALNVGVRKLAHLVEYAVLALLWSRAFRRRGAGEGARRAAWRAIAVAALTAAADEAHQAACAARTGALADVLLDCCGAAAGTIGYQVWNRRRDKCPTSAFPSSS